MLRFPYDPQKWLGENMQLPDFSGKVVILYLSNSTDERGIVLQDPVFQIQGDRLFLLGRIAEGTSPNDWVAGVYSGVAWECVDQYLVFDSLEDYLARASLAWAENPVQ